VEDAIVEILENLGLDPNVVIAQSIAFVVLLVLLWRFLYRPFEAILQQRQQQIASGLSSADTERMRAEALRQEYEAHLANIAEEARQRLEQAVQDAEAARQRMLETAQGEIRDLHRRAEAQLALDRERLRRELRTEVSEIAVMAAAKALRGQLTPSLQTAVVDQVLRDFEQITPPPSPAV
jgi:F-type H+-transporting ATPase subunit b